MDLRSEVTLTGTFNPRYKDLDLITYYPSSKLLQTSGEFTYYVPYQFPAHPSVNPLLQGHKLW